MIARRAAQVLVDQLVLNGVTQAFCVPGESFLPVLDALRDSPIAVIICRQEGGAAMMAEAVGKATGRPGVCFVTRGPGATNAMAGIHIAQQDSTPLLMFVGQVERRMREREAFQELDLRAVFGSMTKWTSEIDDPRRLPELVSRAFYAATAGRPGPVVLGLPRDMLDEELEVTNAPPFVPVEIAPGDDEILQFQDLLLHAARPVFILGGSRWDETAYKNIHDFATRFAIPVVTSYRRLSLFDPLHPSYAGDLGIGPNPKLIAAIKSADLIVGLGGRLGDIPSQGYRLFDIPAPKRLVHVHPGVEELGRVYRPHLAINATPTRFCAALAALTPPKQIAWRDVTASLHRDYLAWTEVATPQPGGVNLGAIMVWLREAVPLDTMLCNGAGNYAAWIHRFYRFRRFGAHVAPASGSMGYGVPAAVAMKLLRPERLVLSLAGDGDFLMNGQEFATAVQYGLPIVFIVCDNASYGSIRMHQEREYPGRVVGTELRNPDFAAYARAFGGFGVTVERTEDFPEAFNAAREARLPAIIHLKIDVDAIAPATSLTRIREQAQTRS
jgi:acetolactate synthase I/II/III large subunit